MLVTLLASVAVAATLQDAPLTADRVTYGQLVDCAATFRLAAAVADVDGQADMVEPALLSAAAYAHLAYLYGGPLGIPGPDTDAAVEAELGDQISRYGNLLGGPSDRLARQVMDTDQRVCRAVSERVLQETGPVSETS